MRRNPGYRLTDGSTDYCMMAREPKLENLPAAVPEVLAAQPVGQGAAQETGTTPRSSVLPPSPFA